MFGILEDAFSWLRPGTGLFVISNCYFGMIVYFTPTCRLLWVILDREAFAFVGYRILLFFRGIIRGGRFICFLLLNDPFPLAEA